MGSFLAPDPNRRAKTTKILTYTTFSNYSPRTASVTAPKYCSRLLPLAYPTSTESMVPYPKVPRHFWCIDFQTGKGTEKVPFGSLASMGCVRFTNPRLREAPSNVPSALVRLTNLQDLEYRDVYIGTAFRDARLKLRDTLSKRRAIVGKTLLVP